MSNGHTDLYRLEQLERHYEELDNRTDILESKVTIVEVKEAGREKKANRAMTAVIALSVSIASGVVVAFLSGGGHP